MGGSAAVHAPVRGLTDLRSEIRRGLRLEALHKTVAHVFRDPAERRRFLYRVVPEGSYKRRIKIGRLTPAQSERVARLAHVVALAEYVWEDTEAARAFLTTPHPELGDCQPIEVAIDEFGAPSLPALGLERNVLINQRHPSFTQIRSGIPRPLVWDARLFAADQEPIRRPVSYATSSRAAGRRRHRDRGRCSRGR